MPANAAMLAETRPEPQGTPRPKRLLFVIDPARAWRWQIWLAEQLTRETGASITFELARDSKPLPTAIRLLFVLEGMLFAGPSPRASELLSEDEIRALPTPPACGGYDLVVDLCGSADRADAAAVQPAFDGIAGDAGALAALLERRAPRLGLLDAEARLTDLGIGALEDPANLQRGLDAAFSRMAGLLLRKLPEIAASPAASLPAPTKPPPHLSERSALAAATSFMLASLAAKARVRLAELLGQAPRWSIAWRRAAPGFATDALRFGYRDFTPLRDDGRRYYADPFVLYRGDTAHVFCEEVPYATGKGIISHFTIAPDGAVSLPRPVLERPYHLSYPFVFERGGETWMIPESSANRSVELYRAECFPDVWVQETVLLDDVLADDATLLEHGGKLWLFAAIRDWQASSWEALGLFHADALKGPWRPHEANPVLLDPSCARPAGAIFAQNGRLIRPAQDCRNGYGSGLSFCRIDRLDEADFVQTVLSRAAPNANGVRGLHTYNRARDLELIDLFGTGAGSGTD